MKAIVPLLILVVSFLFGGCSPQSAEMPRLDKFGGFVGIEREATGFFRLDRINGRDCFITPSGHPFVALGANHIGKFLADPSQNGPLLARFGGIEPKAAEFLFEEVRNLALNAGEAYAPIDPRLAREMPYVLNVRFPVQGKFQFDIFDPEVQAAFRESVFEQVSPIRDDPFVLGIACPDLPIWNQRRAGYHKALPEGSPGRLAYDEFFEANPDASDDDFLGMVADTLYGLVASVVREAAPNHLLFGERFQLDSDLSDPVIRSVGKHVDVFCTQALIRSPQRPPEWQLFQRERWDREQAVTGRPILIIDWAAPFSLDTTFVNSEGTIKNEREATEDTNQFLYDAFDAPYIVGVFKCQLIGSHGNDSRFPEGRMKRTYLQDDGTPFERRTEMTREAHIRVLNTVFESLRGGSD